MKYLAALLVMVMFLGCGGADAPPVEAKPEEPVSEAAQPELPTANASDASLWEAARSGEIELAKKAIDDGANVNAKKEDGETPLHVAVVAALDSGDNKVIELLIENGADVNAKIVSGRAQGMTPLDITELLSETATLTKRLRELQGTTDDIPVADLLRKHGGKTGESSPTTLPATITAPPAELGAGIKRNEQGEIVEVSLSKLLDLHRTEVTDAELEHLTGLTKLETLDLSGTQVTDAGLVHLKGLTKLENLKVTGRNSNSNPSQITDAGLVHLKGLTNLKYLDLAFTQITDAGLVHLKGLTNLKMLNLLATQATAAGVDELKKALPKCRITFI